MFARPLLVAVLAFAVAAPTFAAPDPFALPGAAASDDRPFSHELDRGSRSHGRRGAHGAPNGAGNHSHGHSVQMAPNAGLAIFHLPTRGNLQPIGTLGGHRGPTQRR